MEYCMCISGEEIIRISNTPGLLRTNLIRFRPPAVGLFYHLKRCLLDATDDLLGDFQPAFRIFDPGPGQGGRQFVV